MDKEAKNLGTGLKNRWRGTKRYFPYDDPGSRAGKRLSFPQLPVVGCAPEWMSEKAVSIGNYVVATGIDTFLGVDPYVSGSDQIAQLLTEGVRDWVEAAYTVEKDIDKLGDAMIARIEEKRTALGI